MARYKREKTLGFPPFLPQSVCRLWLCIFPSDRSQLLALKKRGEMFKFITQGTLFNLASQRGQSDDKDTLQTLRPAGPIGLSDRECNWRANCRAVGKEIGMPSMEASTYNYKLKWSTSRNGASLGAAETYTSCWHDWQCAVSNGDCCTVTRLAEDCWYISPFTTFCLTWPLGLTCRTHASRLFNIFLRLRLHHTRP